MTEASSEPTRKAALTGPAAEAAFDAAGAALAAGDRGLAILSLRGDVLYAAPEALRFFQVETTAELSARLTGGEAPTARRLRYLAKTLPVGTPARLERMRLPVGRKPVTANLRCARVLGANGAPLFVLFAPGAARSVERAAIPSGAPQTPEEIGGPTKFRFLWALDGGGRFGSEDSALREALGANAPRKGESLDALRARADIGNMVEWAAAIARRETFSDLVLAWPAAREGFRVRVRLSGAPFFGRAREFHGFRGFGVIEGEPQPELIRARSDEALGDLTALEPLEMAAPPHTAMGPAPADEGVVTKGEADADGSESAPDLPESAEAEAMAGLTPIELSPAPSDESERASQAANPAGPAEPPPTSPQERTAAIYILRQTASSGSARVVPIRPAPEPPPPPTAAPDSPSQDSESIVLSKSERDAFREIARALVGRTPVSRADRFPPPEPPPPPAAPPDRDAESAPAAKKDSEPPPAAPGRDAGGLARNAAVLLEKVPVGVLVARDGRALYLNQTLLTLLGYADLDQFEAADGFNAMFGGTDPAILPTQAAHALTVMRADGEPIAVDGHAQATLWDGVPATLIVFRRAPSDQGAENAPASEGASARSGSADELQAMLDLAADGAVTLDSAGRILTLNASAERLFGYAERDVAGESVLMLLQPQSHPETTARLENLSRSEEFAPSLPLTVVGRRRDGTGLALALTLARLGSGEALHYCALVRDLGRERESERRLTMARDAAQAASAAKTDFLAQVSHEIRTPLHAILGFAEVMLEERFGPIGNERYRDYLRDIHTSGRHVMSLADDLLDLAKIEAGKLELTFTPVDANAVIRECVSLMQPQAARERIIMRVSLAEHMPRLMVDERSLRQILLNLMSNAVKFNEPGGQVIVSTAVDEGGQAVIRVRDTGVGMSESEIGHALEPFGQIGRRNKSGAGLGLPLTKALVEANKAEFSIKSQRERGTLIEIAFPVAQAAQ